jgi:hypothetical protein
MTISIDWRNTALESTEGWRRLLRSRNRLGYVGAAGLAPSILVAGACGTYGPSTGQQVGPVNGNVNHRTLLLLQLREGTGTTSGLWAGLRDKVAAGDIMSE